MRMPGVFFVFFCSRIPSTVQWDRSLLVHVTSPHAGLRWAASSNRVDAARRRRLITLASLASEKKRRDPCKFNALTPKNKSALWASLTYIGLTKHLDHLWGISVCLFACACACVCLHVCNFEINLHCRTWLAHSLPKTDWLKGEKRAFSPKNIHPFYIFYSVTKSTLAFLTPTLFKYWLQLVQNILSVMVFKRIQETFPQQLNLLDFNFLQFVKASCI